MNTSFNQGLTRIAEHLRDVDFDYLLLLDNDCFVWDISVIHDFLEAFQQGSFDFACHLVEGERSRMSWVPYENQVVIRDTRLERVEQTITPITEYPFVHTKPRWENALALFSKRAFLSLDTNELSDFRKLIAGLHTRGYRLASRSVQYNLKYSQYGPGWFHVGNLCPYLGMMGLHGQDVFPEAMQNEEMRKVVMSRVGYTIWEGLRHGSDHRSDKFLKTRDAAAEILGGHSECLQEWLGLIEGTGLSEGFPVTKKEEWC